MRAIEFRFLKNVRDDMRASGCDGILVTSAMLTADEVKRFGEYWKLNHRELADGETLTLPATPTSDEAAA